MLKQRARGTPRQAPLEKRTLPEGVTQARPFPLREVLLGGARWGRWARQSPSPETPLWSPLAGSLGAETPRTNTVG